MHGYSTFFNLLVSSTVLSKVPLLIVQGSKIQVLSRCIWLSKKPAETKWLLELQIVFALLTIYGFLDTINPSCTVMSYEFTVFINTAFFMIK